MGGWLAATLLVPSAPHRTAAVERLTGIPTTLPDLGAVGTFCFVSDFTRRRAAQIGGWRLPRSLVAYPGLSPNAFPPLTDSAERERPDRPWRWRLLWIGRVVASKGIETVTRALGALSQDSMLEIVGPITPAYRAALDTLAAASGVADRLHFAHQVPHPDVRAHYLAADVTLFTSAIEQEAFGLVPLEAMASGCPVVCTGVGGSAEYCQHGVNCLRVPPGDPTALAAAVQRLTADPALRRHLVQGGWRTAARLTLERQGELIERGLFGEIAAQQ